mmetsp:Transcript_1126/g.4730  ORF Transcript_1126/g.4730 Transcript_1126/m.4730 type:complete len:555 (+) Transcript_1126:1652-3316(+)
MFSAPAPTAVARTTSALANTSRSALARVLRPDFAIVFCSRRRRASFASSASFSRAPNVASSVPRFPPLRRSSSRFSQPRRVASTSSRRLVLLAWSKYPAVASRTRASSEFKSAASEMRSGAPMRTKEISPSFFPPSASRDRRSTRLSTAAFDGAHARTLWPDKTARRMISTTTLVLPVPGGPWIQHTGAAPHSAARTASACASSNEDGSGPPPPSAMGRTSSGGRSSNPSSRIGFPPPLPFVAFTNASVTSGEVEKCPGTNAATPPISSPPISSSLISFSSAAASAGGHRAAAKSARTMSAEGGFVRLVGTFRNVLSAAICLSYVVASGTRTRRTRRPPSVCSRLIRAAFLSVSPSDLLSVGFVAPSFFAAEASSRVSTPFAGSISEITASASLRDQGASSTSQLTETKPESSSPPSQSSTRTAATRSPTAKALGGSAPPPSTRRFSSLPPFTGLGRAEVSRKPSIIAPARPTIVPSGTSRSTADADASSFASDCDIAAAAAASASLSASSAAVATSTYRAMSPWSALLDRRRHPPSSSKPARSPFGGSLFARG